MNELPENVIAEFMSTMCYTDIVALFCTHRRFQHIFEKYLIVDYIAEWQSHTVATPYINRKNSWMFKLITHFNKYMMADDRLESLSNTELNRVFAAISINNAYIILEVRTALFELAEMLIEKILACRGTERTIEVFVIVSEYYYNIYNCGNLNSCQYKLVTGAVEHDNIDLIESLYRHKIIVNDASKVRRAYLFRTAIAHHSDRVLEFLRSLYADVRGEFVGYCYRGDISLAMSKLNQVDRLERPQACIEAMHYTMKSDRDCYMTIKTLMATGYLHNGSLLAAVDSATAPLNLYILALQSTPYEFIINRLLIRIYMNGRLDILDHIIDTYGVPDNLLQLINANNYHIPSCGRINPAHPNDILTRYGLDKVSDDDPTCVSYRKLVFEHRHLFKN